MKKPFGIAALAFVLCASSARADDAAASLPDAGMKDPATEAAMMKAVVEHGAEGTPLAAVILSDEWSTERSDLGIIRGRSANGAVSLKRADGTCYYVTAIFKQSFDGSQYGKLRVNTGWGDNEAGVLEELKCPK